MRYNQGYFPRHRVAPRKRHSTEICRTGTNSGRWNSWSTATNAGDHKLRNKEFESFSSSASEKTMKTVLRILTAVVNWERKTDE